MNYRWVAYTPDGLEYFPTREDAESSVCEWFAERLAYTGEAHEGAGWVARIESHCVEVVGATAGDDTRDGEWCRERGYDYKIDGYAMRSAEQEA